jgi:hypothetical protein
MLFPRAKDPRTLQFVENIINSHNLTVENRWEPPLGWGGVWNGQNATGFVSLRLWSPDPLEPTQNEALLIFQPPTEQPIPQALLTSLMATADSTKVTGGDTVEIRFRWEKETPGSKCTSQRTLTVRLNSGALLQNSVVIYCSIQTQPVK